ncbi:EcsC family protein [Streptomyces sp. CNQ085]|uniref:EcsC family protein n=1 Tax=Streptomyces sp. CNQ085 TaxID=2886944 RepID=UPI001F50AAFC|nr:EcsC family protein [Streptomyces sp. CNQ085]MCI0382952.1 EcsC family protein [Streptomyces sp. CNQ085]
MTAEKARDAERGQDGEASLAPVHGSAPATAFGRGLRLFRPRRPVGADRVAGADAPDGRSPREPRERGTVRAFLAVVADRIVDLAPRIPVRDLATLRRQFPGLGPEEMADRLISGAVKGSATVGAGVGASAMLPVPPAMPAELAAEVVGVAAVELKLIAELHEVYGLRPPGNARERATVYLAEWTQERGIELAVPATFGAAFGSHMRRRLRQTLLKRTMRNLPNLTPFMIGAAVGALVNRRDTRKLAETIRGDLRRRRIPWDAVPLEDRPGKVIPSRPGRTPEHASGEDG